MKDRGSSVGMRRACFRPRAWFAVRLGAFLSSVLAASAAGEPPPAAVEALIGVDSRVQLSAGARRLCSLHCGLFTRDWQGGQSHSDVRSTPPVEPGVKAIRGFTLKVPGGAEVSGRAGFSAAARGLKADYTFTPAADVELQCLYVTADFEIPILAGGKWTADDRSGVFPVEFKDPHLFNAAIRALTLELPSGQTLNFSFPAPTQVLLQDNRRWGPSFSVRVYSAPGGGKLVFPRHAPVKLTVEITAPKGVAVTVDEPVTIVAGPDWIPLKLELDPEPGSALDFSGMGFCDPPAGKHGWVIAGPDGHFQFEKLPGKPQRFYGVNLCFGAQYLAREQSEKLAERLRRLGYNTVRLHHYESILTEGGKDSVTLNPKRIEELDYLVAQLCKRGLYVTTDLFVSRSIPRAELGMAAPQGPPGKNPRKSGTTERVGMDEFKILVPVHAKAFENWKAFCKELLTHVNPHTGRSWGQEPGLAWLSLINEGNLKNFWSLIKPVPEWTAAWNRHLLSRFKDRAGLAAAWGGELKAGEDPARGDVALPPDLYKDDRRVREAILFCSLTEKDFYLRAKEFLRKELGCRALLTNMNSWTNHVTDQLARAEFDYVDDHFYVDHPHFLEQPWRLPSRCPNSSPIAAGAPGAGRAAFTRYPGKPFAITEYNYSGPGRYRGVGGILTGALGAIQDWDGIWRFTYSHSKDNLFAPAKMGYFDMASDPLSQAAERASICLFLRRDLGPAKAQLPIFLGKKQLLSSSAKAPNLAPGWPWVGWYAHLGAFVLDLDGFPLANVGSGVGYGNREFTQVMGSTVPLDPKHLLDPYTSDGRTLLKLLNDLRCHPDRTLSADPAQHQYEGLGVKLNGAEDTMILISDRTLGVFAPAGKKVAAGGLEVSVHESDATVWVSSLDGNAIRDSKRLLLTHLTDCQNTEIKYAERARQTLLDWGKLPHLVRAGKASVSLQVRAPEKFRVYALAAGGRRLAEAKTEAKDGALCFTADVSACAREHGAVLCHELIRE